MKLMTETIYHCHACRYTFPSGAVPDRCPDCGAFAVCMANAQQIADYERIRKEIAEEDMADRTAN